jgi:hypothetical protein
MTITATYSDKEVLLFKEFQLDHLLSHVAPVTLYHMAMEKAFITDLRGSAVDSLRRCLIAIKDCGAYRMTPEFDALIDIGWTSILFRIK